MIFRISSDGANLAVEDGEGVTVFTLSLAGHKEAHALIRKALREGVDAIRPEAPKKKATSK
jgi:hypothetical protein